MDVADRYLKRHDPSRLVTGTLLVGVDAEGCTGIRTWQDVTQDYETDEPTYKARRSMAADVNAIIRGARASGRIRRVAVLDWHSRGDNIRHIDVRCYGLRVEVKNWSIDTFVRAARESEYAALVGMHGRYGSPDGEPPMFREEFASGAKRGVGHFNMFGIRDAYLNGRSRGEAISGLFLLKELGVPLVLCTGTWAAVSELNMFAPEIRTCVTGRGARRSSHRTLRRQVATTAMNAALDTEAGRGYVPLNDHRLAYRSFSLQFKRPSDKQGRDTEKMERQFSLFRKLARRGKVSIAGRRVYFPRTGQSPYLNDYRLINEH